MTDSDVPFGLDQLDHVVLRARDHEVLIRFYRNVLGCTLEREAPELGLTQLRAGASLIDIVAADGRLGRAAGTAPRRGGGHNMDHFCLRVTPFRPEAISRHLREHGIKPSEVRHVFGAEGYGPSIYLEDPEGNTIELKGPATGAD
ncbi:MAG: VOC family protein [Pseudomonadales bacterium]